MSDRPSFRFLDHFALWASLGASLYLMPFAALLVPALSIEQAVLATMFAALLAGLLIAAIATLAAHSGHSTAEMLAEPFGAPARRPVALLLLARHAIVTAFALVLIADAAELVSERSLGAGLRPLWVALFAGAALALVLAGPTLVATGMKRAGLWLVLLVAVAVAALAYAEFEVPSYLKRPAAGGWPSFWQAIDLSLVAPLLWLPIVADFARLGRDSRSTARGTFAGFFVASIWFGVLGILYLPATDSGDIPGFVAGMQLGLVALLPLFLLQIDEVYVSAYATGPALTALYTGFRTRFFPALVFVAAIPAAILFRTSDLESYVLMTASVFVPAFAVVLALAIWPASRPSLAPAVAWISGFALYQWLSPSAIGWWRDLIAEPIETVGFTFPLAGEESSIGAAIPAFALAFVMQFVLTTAQQKLPMRHQAQPAAS